MEIAIFKHLKVFRRVCQKNRRSFQIYAPCEWFNGWNSSRVSLQLAELPNGHPAILIDLVECNGKGAEE